MTWLLDTCVLSEPIKPRPARSVIDWLNAQEEDTLFISTLSMGEIEQGIARLADADRAARLRNWLKTELRGRFGQRILPVDTEVAIRWGDLSGKALAAGAPLPVADSIIAATALEHDLVLVTRNTEDFARAGVSIFNPWLTG